MADMAAVHEGIWLHHDSIIHNNSPISFEPVRTMFNLGQTSSHS